MAKIAGRVSSQEDYTLRAVPTGTDEVGNLVVAFNQMLERIQERDSALKGAKDQLEVRVQERTKALQKEILDRKRAENLQRTAYEGTRLLAESDSADAVMPRLMHLICQELGQDAAVIWKSDGSANVLQCAHVWQEPGPSVEKFLTATQEHSIFDPVVCWLCGFGCCLGRLVDNPPHNLRSNPRNRLRQPCQLRRPRKQRSGATSPP